MKNLATIRNRVYLIFFLWGGIVLLGAESAPDLFQNGMQSLEHYGITKDKDDLLAAIEFFLQAVEVNSSYGDAYMALATSYSHLEEYAQAERYADKAQQFSRRSPELAVIYGNIFLGQERMDEASNSFEQVLLQHPHHTDALMGLGDIALAKGTIGRALNFYQQVLVRDPQHFEALLSLIISHHLLGNAAEAESYLLFALRYYGSNPDIQYYAAAHYYGQANLKQARFHGARAVDLREAFIDAMILLGEISLAEGDWDEAESLAHALTEHAPLLPLTWYARARIAEGRFDFDAALDAYRRGIRIAPEHEILRLAFEHFILTHTKLNDPIRNEASAYYLDKAQLLRNALQDQQAMLVLRRGLRIHPFSEEMRSMLADIYIMAKDYHNYLSEIAILRDTGVQAFEDEVEVFESYLSQSVSNKWDVDQFSLVRPRIPLSLFSEAHIDQELHYPFSSEIYLWYLHELFLHSEQIEITEDPKLVGGRAEALVEANHQESDYFLIVSPRENAGFLEVKFSLYVSASGELVEEGILFASGTQQVHRVLRDVMRTVSALIPRLGAVLSRKGTELLFSLGQEDDITVGDSLDIVKQRNILPAAKQFAYSDADVIGHVEITAFDALIGEGRYSYSGFYDQLELGDLVVQKGEVPNAGASQRLPRSLIFDEIRKRR